MRRVENRRGRYNIPNVGIFLWRVKSNPLTATPAYKIDERRWLFNPLGLTTPLYTKTETEQEITHLARPINVPAPISRRVLRENLGVYYGKDETGVLAGSGSRGLVRSILVNVDGHDVDEDESLPQDTSPPPEKLSSLIRVCDLSDLTDGSGNWAHMPLEGAPVAIDPLLGRIAFPAGKNGAPEQDVLVSFYYGFTAEMGGGEYGRAGTFDDKLAPVVFLPKPGRTIQGALNSVTTGGAVEITRYEHYGEPLHAHALDGKKIELRAGDELRPIIVLTSDFLITGEEEGSVSLNGIVFHSGGVIRVPEKNADGSDNKLRLLRLQHCTLLPPGSVPTIEGVAPQVETPRLIIEAPNVAVEVESCIVGPISAVDGARVSVTNSIIDAGAENNVAYAGAKMNASAEFSTRAGAPLEIENSTVIGRVNARNLEASNTIFLAGKGVAPEWTTPVRAERLQEGCVRFSYVPPGSEVPRTYECQPKAGDTPSRVARVRPVFTSLRYGDAGYCQLSLLCSDAITRGADDEAEMGAFHNLYQPQREANLRARLDEYLRFGLEAGIFYAS
jgi:hypothetical protein